MTHPDPDDARSDRIESEMIRDAEDKANEVEERVIQKIRIRRDAGRKKYGVSMERKDLDLRQWFTHAQEEAMDCAIYIEKLIMILDATREAREEESVSGPSAAQCDDILGKPHYNA